MKVILKERPDAEALATMQERGGTWAAYQNMDLGHPDMGDLRFLQYGEGKTLATPPLRMPDTQYGIGWRYVYVGTVDLATGDVVGKETS